MTAPQAAHARHRRRRSPPRVLSGVPAGQERGGDAAPGSPATHPDGNPLPGAARPRRGRLGSGSRPRPRCARAEQAQGLVQELQFARAYRSSRQPARPHARDGDAARGGVASGAAGSSRGSARYRRRSAASRSGERGCARSPPVRGRNSTHPCVNGAKGCSRPSPKGSYAVVVTHYIAIDVAVGATVGDDRVVDFQPDYCSVSVLRSAAGRFELVRRGSEAATWVCEKWLARRFNVGSDAAANQGLSGAAEVSAHLGEHGAEHLRRQPAGVRVEPRAVIAVEQRRALASSCIGAMAEGAARRLRAEREQRGVVGDLAERHDGLRGVGISAIVAGEEAAAGADLRRRRLVLRRHAAHGVGDAGVDQLEPVVGPGVVGAARRSRIRAASRRAGRRRSRR